MSKHKIDRDELINSIDSKLNSFSEEIRMHLKDNPFSYLIDRIPPQLLSEGIIKDAIDFNPYQYEKFKKSATREGVLIPSTKWDYEYPERAIRKINNDITNDGLISSRGEHLSHQSKINIIEHEIIADMPKNEKTHELIKSQREFYASIYQKTKMSVDSARILLANEETIRYLKNLSDEDDFDNPMFLRSLAKAVSIIQAINDNGGYIGLFGDEAPEEIAEKMSEKTIEARNLFLDMSEKKTHDESGIADAMPKSPR